MSARLRSLVEYGELDFLDIHAGLYLRTLDIKLRYSNDNIVYWYW